MSLTRPSPSIRRTTRRRRPASAEHASPVGSVALLLVRQWARQWRRQRRGVPGFTHARLPGPVAPGATVTIRGTCPSRAAQQVRQARGPGQRLRVLGHGADEVVSLVRHDRWTPITRRDGAARVARDQAVRSRSSWTWNAALRPAPTSSLTAMNLSCALSASMHCRTRSCARWTLLVSAAVNASPGSSAATASGHRSSRSRAWAAGPPSS